ncbi:MAG: FAD-binding oxidoreductase, partial [Gemmatimonadetes bacterium]|nr:FAD-binding oxidoreductase [Gemmatimonadota bacterium]
MAAHPDVLVVGGGAIGCAIALRLAQRAATVTLIERGVPGAAATSAAAGMLSPLGELRHAPPLARLGLASLAMWPAFADELTASTGIDVEFRRPGTLHVALSARDDAMLDDVLTAGIEHGAGVLSGDEARQLEPALSTAVRRAVLSPRDACVDNRRLGHALWHAAQDAGVHVRAGARVTELLVDASSSRVRGVRLDDGSTIEAHTIVIAAGAWSGMIRGLPAHRPVRPVRGEMFSVSAGAALSSDTTGQQSIVGGAGGWSGRE